MDYQQIIDFIYTSITKEENIGEVATYIPALRETDPDKFGVYLITTSNEHSLAGNWNEKFSIQSISKVLSLALAYKNGGKDIWKRVGTEPSGTPFNSLVQLEHDQGIPRNPMINSGAIVICDILIDQLNHPKKDLLNFIREISGNDHIEFDQTIMKSEKTYGYRNIAVINFMKTFGNIHNDIDLVMDLYYNLCSIKMTCKELCETFLFLANNGNCLHKNKSILTVGETKRINAIMQTCGFYDEAGEFSYRVGLPGKSGVGGGIIAVHPTKYCVTVWSPKLNKKGNSHRGMRFLEQFTTATEQSIF